MENTETLTFWDYLLFVVTLLMSAAVGVFYSVKAARRKTAESNVEYLLGNRRMPVIPTAMSVLTSILSSILLIGIPAEVYQRGVNAWIYTVAGAISMIINCFVFLPVFYKFQPTSVHDYFVARFNSYFLRTVVGGAFVLSTLFYMSIVLYAPAVALSKVVNFPVWVSIISVGLVCTFYTTLGGLKAVVWADTFQTLIMFVGVLVLVVKGTNDAGGWDRVWALSEDYGRITPARNLDPNPFQYMSLWAAIFSAIPFWLAQYGVSQMAVQRYCSLETIREARQVIAITTPLFVILSSLPCFLGLIMFAYFFQCDPLKSGTLRTRDQLVIYFVMKILGEYPGLPGLFLACLCSGTLSTVSSGVNSMVAVTWEDLLPWSCFQAGLKDRLGSRGAKMVALIFGLAATGLAFACEELGGVMKTMQSIVGGFTGPLTGLFTLGILVPRANRNGAVIGFLISIIFVVWIMVGNLVYSPYRQFIMPSYDYGCNTTSYANFSDDYLPPVTPPDESHYGDPNVFILYRISQWYYPIVGFLLVMIFGTLGSFIPVDLVPCDKKEDGLNASTSALTLQSVIREKKSKRRRQFVNDEPVLQKFQMHETDIDNEL